MRRAAIRTAPYFDWDTDEESGAWGSHGNSTESSSTVSTVPPIHPTEAAALDIILYATPGDWHAQALAVVRAQLPNVPREATTEDILHIDNNRTSNILLPPPTCPTAPARRLKLVDVPSTSTKDQF